MTKDRSFILTALIFAAGCVVLLIAGWFAISSPVMAAMLNPTPQRETRPKPFARAMIAKPSNAAPATGSAEPVSTGAENLAPQAEVPAATAAPTATSVPVIEVAPTVESQPGVVYAEIIADTPTPEYVAPTAASYAAVTGSGEHWIDVDLSQQRVYAYEGDNIVNSFLVSTGTWQTPTVTGKYKIWVKLRSAPMSGPGYYLPDVPYVMYFYGSYGLHGTYWHNNFGTPMSHGCVNLSIPDAQWLYNFSSVGTVVNVHY